MFKFLQPKLYWMCRNIVAQKLRALLIPPEKRTTRTTRTTGMSVPQKPAKMMMIREGGGGRKILKLCLF